jgi:NAD-specific glutamate dehydrogenase
MAAPTIGFSVGHEDQERVRRLAARYAHGNRSSWLRQAIDLFEEKALFDTLADVQARGDRLTAQRGIDRDVLAGLVAQAAANPDSRHSHRVAALVEQFAGGGDELDELEADHDAAEAFMSAPEAAPPAASGI